MNSVAETLDKTAVAVPGRTAGAGAASPHPLLDRAPSVVAVGDIAIGGPRRVLLVSCGPLEDARDAARAAERVARAGGQLVQVAAFERATLVPRPEGAWLEELRLLREAAPELGLGVVAEVSEAGELAEAAERCELIHVPAHLMQSFTLLQAAGGVGRPVLLSRAPAATLEEWLLSAEYVLLAGAPGVIFCETGIRTLAHGSRPTLDLTAVAALRHVYRLPVLAAPTRAAGSLELVRPLARAALAAGACGLLAEPMPTADLSSTLAEMLDGGRP